MFWNKTFTKRRVLIQKIYNAWDFGSEKIQRFRFWIEIFSTCQFLEKCLYPENHV